MLRPLFVRFADLDIAMRIEERWPGLNDRLASTIQFVRLDAKTIATARRPCARRPSARPSRKPSTIDFREVIEPKPVMRALAVAAGALCLGAALARGRAGTVADRHEAAVRSVRIDTSWPRQTHLVLDESQTTLKVARGDSFTLSVKVRPGDKVPESAQATYRFADGEGGRRAAPFDRGGRVPGPDRVGQSAVSVLGRRRRRFHLDPRRGRQGRAASRPEVARGQADRSGVHRACRPRCSPRA